MTTETPTTLEPQVGLQRRVMPPWWTEADTADARSNDVIEAPHLTLEPPEADGDWGPFNAECEEWERLVGEHYDANKHRWRCRTCAFWQSGDGRSGIRISAELGRYRGGDEPTSAEDNPDCAGFFARSTEAA